MSALASPVFGYENYWDKLKHDAIDKYNGSTKLTDEFKKEFLNLSIPDLDKL